MATLAKRLTELRGGSRRQGDLGDEDQGRPAGVTRCRRQSQVDLRLAAAGDAVQQCNLEGCRSSQRPQPIDRLGLLICQGSDPGSDLGSDPGSDPGSDAGSDP